MKRKPSRKQRRKINRTGKLSCPICNNKEILVEHHIRGKEIPNYNHPSNICNICSNCHRHIHEGLVIIEGWMKTTNGTELFWHDKAESSFTGDDAIPYLIE